MVGFVVVDGVVFLDDFEGVVVMDVDVVVVCGWDFG